VPRTLVGEESHWAKRGVTFHTTVLGVSWRPEEDNKQSG
jgi:hypothetical protein